nr:hypothetical protein BaRGS_005831 [Batillaria attramentaria]
MMARLDDNLIETVSENTFSPATRSRLQSLNLSHNPFQCTCSLLWFRNWAMSSQSLFDFQNDDSVYECKNLIPDTDLAAFIMNEQQCLLGHDAYVFTVVCTGVLISTITVMTLLYRYRWHVRLRVYEAFRGSPHARPKERDPADFQFDLFVSYDSEDSPWVVRHLVPVLEQQLGLRLCVHQRDFIPGKNIVENIVDSLASSRRVLAIFSPSFAESRWCHFELEMCLSHVIDNNDVMVIVILQHVPSRDMSGAMLALVKTTTYIEWVEDPDAIASFWRRLTLALRDILPGEDQGGSDKSTPASPLQTQDIFADLLRNIVPSNIVEVGFRKAQTKYSTNTEEVTRTLANGTQVIETIVTQTKSSGKSDSVNVIGLIFVAAVLGIAANRIGKRGKPFVKFFVSAAEIVIVALRWFFWTSPLGVASLIAKAIAGIDDLEDSFSKLGMFVVVVVVGMVIYQFGVLSLLLFLFTRRNPIKFHISILRPYFIGFASTSTAVALPEMLYCCEVKNGIDRRVARFAVPFSVTLSANGSAVFIVSAAIFIGQYIGYPLTAGDVVLIT